MRYFVVFVSLLFFLMADYVADILQRICRLSIEEEDREEPMVSDADHHEDFQVTYTGERGCFIRFLSPGGD